MAGLANLSDFFSNPLFTAAMREVPVEQKFIGSRFLPIEETYDIDFNESVLTRQADMADLVDSGAELPLTDRDPMARVKGEITDMGQSYIVTKKELAAMLDKGNPAKRALAVKMLLGKAAQVKKNIDARIEWLRWQALGTGQLAYNKSGIILGSDFGVPGANFKTAGTKWNASTPTILADYELWVQAYVDLNGDTPDVFVTGIAALRAFMNDATVRKQITGLTDKLVTLDELNAFLVGRQMPKVEAFDASVVYRDVMNGGTRVSQRLLSAKKGVFLKEGGAIGSQLLGPTYENNMEPGIFARTFTMERPVREVVEVVAASYPKIMAPGLIMPCDILA
jgi:hypothetical protein